MAIEIITAGVVPAEQLYRKTCGNCGTLFQFARKDAAPLHAHTDTLEVACPLTGCGRKSVVMPSDKFVTVTVKNNQNDLAVMIRNGLAQGGVINPADRWSA